MSDRTALQQYLQHVRLIRGSNLASDERSYYPALDTLFNAIGAELNPKVVAIHDVADKGAGHPDYVLQVETTKDARAAVEAKPASANVDEIARSEQVQRYVRHYGACLVTNLRQFVLLSLDGEQPREIMRFTVEASEMLFWQTPVEALVKRVGDAAHDFLTNVLLWQAPVTRPKDLAEALARHAREALRRLEHRSDTALNPLREALSQALGLHFTGEDGEHFFRSSLVQTLFYGLFSAWVVWNRENSHRPAEDFRWREAGDYLSLPVLRELYEYVGRPRALEMLDIRQPLEWAEATLRRTIWGNFGEAFAHGDAVNYFYEPFLEAYDPELREQLGVWYTPREIITYQVARVHRLLREELDIADGLADERVVVLDPATGTGGYLLEVLRVINATLQDRGGLRGMELRQAATRRIFGFEILPAPFVVAHLQIATLLADMGATLGKQDRAGVYLTNALTGWTRQTIEQASFEGWPALRKEVEAAEYVKHDAKVLVILGNPPYYKFAGVGEDEEQELVAPYYVGLNKQFDVQARSINDLYVRFFRLAERQIAENTGTGIVSFITNFTWLDGLSNIIMRKHILEGFDKLWVDSLNGDMFRTGKRTPWNTPDQSIFTTERDPRGIKPGTAISTLVRTSTGDHLDMAQVHWRQLWGKAEEKRRVLLGSLNLEELAPEYVNLHPSDANRFLLMPATSDEDYDSWPSLDQIFVHSYPGVLTSRDSDLVSIDAEPLQQRMLQYFDPNVDNATIARIAPSLMRDTNRFPAEAVRRELLKSSGFREERLVRIAYRPFDNRWLYWEERTKLLDEKRSDFVAQVFPGNLFLEVVRRQRKANAFDHGNVVAHLMDYNYVDGGARCFPLFIRPQGQMFGEQHPNLSEVFLANMPETYRLLPHAAEHLFFHIVATLNAPDYRTGNAGSIERDWPHIPIPASRERLEASARLGRKVGDLLRPDVPFTPAPELRSLAIPMRAGGGQLGDADLRVTVRYNGVGRYDPAVVEGPVQRPARLWWNDVGYWNDVPANVWAFTIGGYPVIKKWLDYRHIEKLKRPLRLEEVRYVTEMAQRIAALLALGAVLDKNYQAVKAEALAAVGVKETI